MDGKRVSQVFSITTRSLHYRSSPRVSATPINSLTYTRRHGRVFVGRGFPRDEPPWRYFRTPHIPLHHTHTTERRKKTMWNVSNRRSVPGNLTVHPRHRERNEKDPEKDKIEYGTSRSRTQPYERLTIAAHRDISESLGSWDGGGCRQK